MALARGPHQLRKTSGRRQRSLLPFQLFLLGQWIRPDMHHGRRDVSVFLMVPENQVLKGLEEARQSVPKPVKKLVLCPKDHGLATYAKRFERLFAVHDLGNLDEVHGRRVAV